MKPNQFVNLVGNMGGRYVVYRGWYTLQRKAGLLKMRFPAQPKSMLDFSLSAWKNKTEKFFFSNRRELQISKEESKTLATSFKRIIQGELCFFSNEWIGLGLDYDWKTNPKSGHRYQDSVHWSAISDYSEESGDIKYVWEKSRFSFLYDIIRYDYHFDEDNSIFVFTQIEDWIKNNPVNLGPNFICSQEISIRLLNWSFALHFYSDSIHLDQDRFSRIMQSVYWQLKHVYENINFSRITVRNNHAISETLVLYLTKFLFPQIPEADRWSEKGKKWFEKEIEYQIYSDGTYLQFSHNYQRVVVQLLTWAIRLSELNEDKLKEGVYSRAKSCLNYMVSNVQDTGEVPNYGSNDGALFFPLSQSAYIDYRGQLNALAFVLGQQLSYPHAETEEAQWYGGVIFDMSKARHKVSDGIHVFKDGGKVVLRDDNTFTFFSNPSYRDRPAQADNLHLDIWVEGQNVIRDVGTHSYNSSSGLHRYFMSSRGHNTITIGGDDHMTKGGRFIWYDWIKDATIRCSEDESQYVIEAGFRGKYELTRKIIKLKGESSWDIVDGSIGHRGLWQHWHVNPACSDLVKMTATDEEGRTLIPTIEPDYYSSHYGRKAENQHWIFKTDGSKIQTRLSICIMPCATD